MPPRNNPPVGATWKGINEYGYGATIWLKERNGNSEYWSWSANYPDGSIPGHWRGWDTSYRGCKINLPIICKMKRIK